MKKKIVNNSVVVPEIKLDLSILNKVKKYSVDFLDIDQKITASFIKQMREKYNMSQSFFARVLGVSKKAIEKWEQGVNPISGLSARLVYLLDKYPQLINEFYLEQHTIDHSVVATNQNQTMDICVRFKVIEVSKTIENEQPPHPVEECLHVMVA